MTANDNKNQCNHSQVHLRLQYKDDPNCIDCLIGEFKEGYSNDQIIDTMAANIINLRAELHDLKEYLSDRFGENL